MMAAKLGCDNHIGSNLKDFVRVLWKGLVLRMSEQ